jgi:hypothetical protein
MSGFVMHNANFLMHMKIVDWRKRASQLARDIKECNYIDQGSRVIMSAEIRTLRKCANDLRRILDKV